MSNARRPRPAPRRPALPATRGDQIRGAGPILRRAGASQRASLAALAMAKFLPPAAAAAAYRVSADHLADVVAAYREVADILDAAAGPAESAPPEAARLPEESE